MTRGIIITLAGIAFAAIALSSAGAATNRIQCPADPDRLCKGTKKADLIIGNSGPNVINARAGADIVKSRGATDNVVGGPGDDRLFGGPGDEIPIIGRLIGGRGNDRIYGGGGNDSTMVGGKGNDRISGGPGDDTVDGRFLSPPGDRDILNCGPGNDLVVPSRNDKWAKNCELVKAFPVRGAHRRP